jgi:hypothetical protein
VFVQLVCAGVFLQFSGRSMCSELIDKLVRELGISRAQAQGGAGLLLQWAQAHLSADQFQVVADTIPAISDVIGKSPVSTIPSPHGPSRHGLSLLGWLTWCKQLCSRLGSLAPLAGPLLQLGLPLAKVEPLVATVLQYFREQGGPEVELLLKRVLR